MVQFHWGGGTPTYLSAAQLEELFLFTKERFTFAPDAEIGVEVDPRVTREEQLRRCAAWDSTGSPWASRISTPWCRRTVRRIQPYEMTRALFDLCRALAFRIDQRRPDLWASASDAGKLSWILWTR